MGTPIDKNEPANLCSVCWGDGKKFGPGPAPRFVTVQLSNFIPGSLWTPDYDQFLLTPYHLIQLPSPCQWQLYAPPFQWFLNYAPGFTFFIVVHIASGLFAFRNTNAPECATDIPSALTHGLDRIAYGGTCHVSWNPEYL